MTLGHMDIGEVSSTIRQSNLVNVSGLRYPTWNSFVCNMRSEDILLLRRTYYLNKDGAELEQALVRYALDILKDRGFHFMSCPNILHGSVFEGCGVPSSKLSEYVFSVICFSSWCILKAGQCNDSYESSMGCIFVIIQSPNSPWSGIVITFGFRQLPSIVLFVFHAKETRSNPGLRTNSSALGSDAQCWSQTQANEVCDIKLLCGSPFAVTNSIEIRRRVNKHPITSTLESLNCVFQLPIQIQKTVNAIAEPLSNVVARNAIAISSDNLANRATCTEIIMKFCKQKKVDTTFVIRPSLIFNYYCTCTVIW